MQDLEDFPIDPAEATDLALHVRNCIKRHVIQVRIIREGMLRRQRSDMIAWLYRLVVIPALGFACWQLWALRPAIDKLISLGPMVRP